MCKNQSIADEVRQFEEQNDESLLNLLISGKDKLEGNIDGVIHCPICQSDTIQVVETAEGDSERVYFQMKCPVCECEFVMVEDLTNACLRGIENAKAEIEYNKNKINYFNKKLRGE